MQILFAGPEKCLLPTETQGALAGGSCEGVCDPLAHLPGWNTWSRDFSMTPMKHGSYNYKTTYNHPPVTQDSDKSSAHMISADDVEYPREYRTLGNGTRRFSNVGLVHTSERRHTVIAAQSLEALTGMQKSDMDRKREAFLDHLKHKYPHHATAIRGQQERLREQQGFEAWSACEYRDGASKIEAKTRSPRHSQSQQSGLADQAAKLPYASAESLETMSEAQVPMGFTRSNRFRQSLPLSRSTSQAKLRSPGVLFLQFGDETRRVHITHEIGSMDTLHALIVHMFPQKLTMGMLKSPNTAILIKDESRNIFYELEDVRDIQDRSIIKIFRKDPIYAPYPVSHIANGDLRREMVYTSRESSPTRRLSSVASGSPHHLVSAPPAAVGLQQSSSSCSSSSSPSRSRMSYSGGRPPSYTGSPVHHAERLAGGMPPSVSQPVSPSPSASAILERRDVKPDEDMSNKNVVLMKHESLYADPYSMVHDGRLSIASTQSLAGLQDPFSSYPGSGLYRRGSIRSLSTYSAAGLHGDLEDSFYKPSPPNYGDGYGAGPAYRMGPSSPQKIPDGRMVDVQQGQSPHSPYSAASSRSPPVRQSFRKDPAPVAVAGEGPAAAGTGKARANMAPEALPGPAERPGPGERPVSGYSSPLPPNDPETRERMEAMEKQIASLTGLVQNALLRGNEGESSSDKSESVNDSSGTGTLSPSVRTAAANTVTVNHTTAITRLQMQLHLHDLQQNASDLRTQLLQLRKLQLQSQDTLKHMMKRLESEISVRVSEALRKPEDPMHRQRALVEEERQKYLNDEEMIIQQLNDLERSVDDLQRDAALSQRLITGPELEEKALVLRQLSETLTELKAQFPSLQSKMRVILRVEVEAVKFLKEEPQRLDVLLKRCKTITDSLATLRRQANEMQMRGPEEAASQSPKHMSTDGHSRNLEFEIPTSPPLNLQETHMNLAKSWQSHNTNLTTFSHHSPAHGHSSHNPAGTVQGAAGQSNSVDEAPAPSKRTADRTVSVEAAERDWEEKRAGLQPITNKDISRLLEETQAELMKAIPDLGFGNKPRPVATPTADQRPSKPQHVQKPVSKVDINGRRHSEELTVHRYRTEKPSKSPPPPPPRRSFPSTHGLTTGRTGEVIVTSKKETPLKKADSDETDTQRPHVKLRRTMSEAKPPSNPPPVVASGIRDDDDEEERIMAELEVFERSSVPAPGWRAVSGQGLPALPTTDTRSCRLCPAAGDQKEIRVLLCPSPAQLPQIVLTECTSDPSSPSEPDVPEPTLAGETGGAFAEAVALGGTMGSVEPAGSSPAASQQNMSISETWTQDVQSSIVLEEFALLEAALVQDVHTWTRSPSPAQPPTEAPEKLLDISSFSPSHLLSIHSEAATALMENQTQGIVREKGENGSSSKDEELGTLQTPARQPEEPEVMDSSMDKRPIVVILEEPTALKRLSTVFEDHCEQLQTVREESVEEKPALSAPDEPPVVDRSCRSVSRDCTFLGKPEDLNSETGHSLPDTGTLEDTELRDGNSKNVKVSSPDRHPNASAKSRESRPEMGRRSLQVVVYEEEEKLDQVTGRTRTEVKKLKINEIEHVRSGTSRDQASAAALARTEEIKNSTYKTMDSLEETIRELESTISQISQHPCTDFLLPTEFLPVPNNQEKREDPVDKASDPTTERGRGVGHDATHPKDRSSPVPPDSRKPTSPTKVKPNLLPKPQLLSPDPKGGGWMPIPPAPKLKQQSCEKLKHNKQREDYLKLQGHQGNPQ
ncbi:SRC kinase signaling inhibitor 1 isoform X3 [Amblyraja radiata]|uniref:SRC kinase signaling inhibitor 1 isoform X3 n=1 Tax=Amblyraja radiata TaxID=386614 RepID=UPI0014034F45|nr:SRC kinase signaling inhibitor 1 isoform X3 [Amblyraja radiata]